MSRRSSPILAAGLCLALSPLVLPVPVASAAEDKKQEAQDIPGLDLSRMTSTEVQSLRKLVAKYPSACGKPHSLLVSLRTDAKCKRSLLAAKTLQRWLMEGFLESEAEERYEARFLDKKRHDIDLHGAAVRGDPKARVTIVEFSDFECPHCKLAEPLLKKILEEFRDVRLVFLNFPLAAHQNAGPAAAAAIAAGKQGRFWAYHDKLFENQGKLGPADLLRYAKELSLDLGRFQADMEGAKARVAYERSLGEKVELTGTPTFFINGRRYTDSLTYEAMRGWIEEELAR